MMTYEEMRKEFVKRVAKIQNWSKDDWDFLNEEYAPKLENGDDFGDNKIYFEEKIYRKAPYDYEIITIIAYYEPTYDSDGNDMFDDKIIGYDFEF